MRISDWSSDVCSSDLLRTAWLPPPASRKVPILYGNQAVRKVPKLVPATVRAQAGGVFDLPYAPELVSAWMRATGQAQISGNHANAGLSDRKSTRLNSSH